MDDSQILDLYFSRSEAAIAETANKYGKYCHSIAFRILHDDEDCKECVNDAYLNAWNSIPPHRPENFKTFLGSLVRNLSINKYRQGNAKKRGKGQMPLVIEELYECLPSGENTEQLLDRLVLTDVLNRFLAASSPEARKIFMRRYYHFGSIREISEEYGISESKVKMSLLRSRNELKQLLQKEGIFL